MSLKNFLTSRVFFKQILVAVIAIVIIVFIMMQWLKSTTNHGQEIHVPDLSKKTVGKASGDLEKLNLDYIVLDTVDYKADYPPYSVVEQDPLPNATVKEGRKIYLKVNAGGYNDVALPDLIQKTHRAVVPILKSVGLEPGEVTYRPYLAKDVVLEVRQNGKKLSPGDKVKKASKIDLVLGDGETGYSASEEELENMP